ncbi:MAG: Sensory box histidine kinase [Moraxellaceae bacterium]|nr:Sensory box histidine kinase [Moraxellaceae bacterium]
MRPGLAVAGDAWRLAPPRHSFLALQAFAREELPFMNLPLHPLSRLSSGPAADTAYPHQVMKSSSPLNEQQRLAALRALQLLDSPPDCELDRVTRLAARLLDVPIALVSLVAEEHEWFYSRVGLDIDRMARSISFCTHTICETQPMVVEDAREDSRFRDNPAVQGEPRIIFYIGQTLYSRAGEALGTLCLIDHVPRRFTPDEMALFADMACMAQERLHRLELGAHARALGQDSLRLEYALRESERRYVALFNNRTNGIMHMCMVCDDHGKVVNYAIEDVNETYERLMGVARKDLQGKLVTEAFPGIDQLPGFSFLVPYAEVAMSGQEASFERFFPPLGRWFNVYVYSPAHGECISIFSDITEKKAYEVAAREREEMLRATFEQAGVGIVHVDPRGFFLRANRKFCDMLGYAEGELLEKHFSDLTAPGDHERTLAIYERILAGESATSMLEKRYIRKDGGLIWCRISVTLVRQPDSGTPRFNVVMVEDITERKQAEAALERERTQLQAILDNSPVLISIKDAEARLVLANRAIFDQMQIPPAADAVGKSIFDLLPAPVASAHWANDQAALAAGGPLHCEETALHRDGSWHVYETVKFPLQDSRTGEGMSICAISMDITARKAAEAERESLMQELEAAAIDANRSRAQLEAVFESIEEGIAVFDMQGNLVMLNQALARIHRFARVDDLKRHRNFLDRLYELHDSEGRRVPPGQQPAARVLRGERFSDWQARMTRPDIGYSGYVSYSGAPVHDEKGRQVLAVLVHRDISASKALEQELQEVQRGLEQRVLERTAELEAANAALVREQERTRVVLETATDAYVAADEKGRITDWNRAAERMFGWHAEDVMGRTVTEILIPVRYRSVHDLGFGRMCEGDMLSDRGREFTARHFDGHEFPVEISLSANRFDDSWAVSAFLRDISERKQGEAALRRAHDELAQSLSAEQAAARAAEAAKSRAEAALQLAEAANRAKSEFLATMSHEIRTPLNGVIGFNGLLLDGPLTEDKRHYAELARRSGEALLHLLNDFLDFSKIESGYLELEPTEFDPRLEAGNAISLVRESALGKPLHLDCRVEAPACVRGDAARLRQILLNLLANAVKFTESGEIRLHCEELTREEGRVWLLFEVIDTGIGIDASVRDRLFQPFVQADASTTRRFGGTGLGLAICKRLAEAMGGKIGVRSELGKGSTFWVKLPFEWVAGSTDKPESPPEIPRVGGAEQPRGRVLVVEDNPVSQLMAAEMLKRLGCRVDVAGNGLEAVEALRRLPYDLIFMDCDMPLMNGFDATRAIRLEEHGKRRVPIVAITASALKGDSERCLSVGMDDFMSKPFRLQDMARMVDAWLEPVGTDGPPPSA